MQATTRSYMRTRSSTADVAKQTQNVDDDDGIAA